jgi:hypothetical protein
MQVPAHFKVETEREKTNAGSKNPLPHHLRDKDKPIWYRVSGKTISPKFRREAYIISMANHTNTDLGALALI